MKKKNRRSRVARHSYIAVIFCIQCLIPSKKTFSQDFSAAIAKADTSHFINEKKAGWILYNSYVNEDSKDTATWEVIIQHDRKSINWKEEQYIGRIKNNELLPAKDRRIRYNLLKDVYAVRIAADGKCYLSLAEGSLPPFDPVIIPVQIRYSIR